MMIVYGVLEEMTKPQIERAIWSQNLADFDQKDVSTLKLRFKTGPKGESKDAANWVTSVTPDITKRLRYESQAHVDWISCRVQDYVAVTESFKWP